MNTFSVIIGYAIPFFLYRILIEWIALISFFSLSYAYVSGAYNSSKETHEEKLRKSIMIEKRNSLLEKIESKRVNASSKKIT